MDDFNSDNDWEKYELTEAQIKKIEEQQMVEKSDNELTQSLFNNNTNNNKLFENNIEHKKIENKNKIINDDNILKRKQIIQKKRKELEEKQKIYSLKLKLEKEKKNKEDRIFGKIIEDKYIDYYSIEDI